MSSVPVFAEPEELMDLVRDTSKKAGRDYVIVDVRGDDYDVSICPFERKGCIALVLNAWWF